MRKQSFYFPEARAACVSQFWVMEETMQLHNTNACLSLFASLHFADKHEFFSPPSTLSFTLGNLSDTEMLELLETELAPLC